MLRHLKKIATIPEHGTSQGCPCCENRSLNPYETTKEEQLNNNIIKETKKIHKHHLLCCTNKDCDSRWWNRNVAGAFNILSRGLKLLESATIACLDETLAPMVDPNSWVGQYLEGNNLAPMNRCPKT